MISDRVAYDGGRHSSRTRSRSTFGFSLFRAANVSFFRPGLAPPFRSGTVTCAASPQTGADAGTGGTGMARLAGVAVTDVTDVA